jgi:hypothetical protein
MGYYDTDGVLQCRCTYTLPPMVMVTSYSNQQRPTLDMPQYNCDIYATPTVCPTQTSLTSLAHELHYVVSANYYVAVIRETTGAEDHM